MEITDAADAGGPGDELVRVAQQFPQRADVLGVAPDQAVARVLLGRLADVAVLGEIIQADDFVPGLQQLFDQVAADKAAGAGDKDLHRVRGSEFAVGRLCRQVGGLPADGAGDIDDRLAELQAAVAVVRRADH
jgi:hypothetical protein